tara:strand:- start:1254 stop:2060 length:807 start_codon:yes stop_codon:yes gene_type:complete
MMSQLKISLIQTTLFWENASKNRTHFESKIASLPETDLILLPEMFSTGFSMNITEVSESMNGETIEWMQKMAEKKQAVVCGSLIIKEGDNYFNRLIWMPPNGNLVHYDKRHLFRMAGENDYFSGGEKRTIIELKGWKICPLICYDLRFPVWSRNRNQTDRKTFVEPEYDLLIYIANWPQPRVDAWKKLLYARAIENQVFVAGLNRIGTDGNEVPYSGGSMVLNAKGEELWTAADHQEEIQTIRLDLKTLEEFRKKFPVGMDGDKFELS